MTESSDRETSIWLRSRPARQGRVVLTRERIVEKAIALLDAEGTDRLTMRRLAERLDTGSTTLYWHVDTKADVLDLALDAVVGEVPLPDDSDAEWRDGCRQLIVAWRATLLRHPWAATLLGRPMLGPNSLARMEFLQATLTQAGLEERDVAAAAWALYSIVVGVAATEATFPLNSDQRRAALRNVLAQPERYPTLAVNPHALEEDWTPNFVAGVDFLLDGIAARSKPR